MTSENDFIFEKDVEVAAGAMNSGGLGGGSSLGGLSGLTGSMNRSGGAMGSSGPAGLQYSIPGILHFLQHEWARFEMERGQWEVEKAELQVIKHIVENMVNGWLIVLLGLNIELVAIILYFNNH